MRTCDTTLPPRCAMPIVSAVRTCQPLSCAAWASTFAASTVPCPPTPESNTLPHGSLLPTPMSRETSVLAPRLAHDSGSSSMPPLTVEASVGSRSAVIVSHLPMCGQKPSFWQSFPGFRRDRAPPPRFRAAKPQVGFSAAENRELRLPKRRFCRTSGGGNGTAGATGRESALVQRRSMGGGRPLRWGGGRAYAPNRG